MDVSLERKGLVYTPLFRTSASYNFGRGSLYYLHKETGKGYRIRYDGKEFHEVFLGMSTQNRPAAIGGFEIVEYLQRCSGDFPFFAPKLGVGLVETFDHPSKLVYPCGLVSWNNDRPLILSELVEFLDKEKIVLKKPIPDDLQFHYSHALVEMYDTYNPFDYL